jgi:hypothetical protein
VHCALWAKSGQAQPTVGLSMGSLFTSEAGEFTPHGAPAMSWPNPSMTGDEVVGRRRLGHEGVVVDRFEWGNGVLSSPEWIHDGDTRGQRGTTSIRMKEQ